VARVKQAASQASGGLLMVTANQATFPGFPFPNTTQIPNGVIDSLMPHLSGGELKVLLYICRRTFGFQKDSDHISLSQISKGIITRTGKVLDSGTGLCKRQVINALKALEKKNIISITRTVDETGLSAVNTYRLNMAATGCAAETPVHHGGVNQNAPPVVNSPSPGVVHSSAPTKQREQKKEEQNKDIDDDAVGRDLENFGMTKSFVTSLISRYPTAYIAEKLAMTHGLLAERSALVAKNPVGWLRRAIEENYQPPRTTRRPPPAPDRKRPHSTETPKEQQRQQTVATPPVELPQPDKQTEEIWQQTIEQLKHDLPLGETQSRLTGTVLIEVTATKAVIFVPNHSALAWLERRLYRQIQKALTGVVGRDVDLQFVTSPS
jgi:phage replication O-like protein O